MAALYVEISEEVDQCPCGKSIKEHCYIKNRLNDMETYVENVCINQFLEIETGNLFGGLKRLRDDPEANANEAVIEYARRNGFIREREYQFLHDTKRKRKLSSRQLSWKRKINWRILNKMLVKRRTAR